MVNIAGGLVGVAGEYFVAAELSRRGHLATITLKNTKGIDVLASNEDGSKQVGIQVKTNQINRREWILNQKAEYYNADNLFFVFVILKRELERPEFFIVPSKVVAHYTKTMHLKWLETPGKKGQAHRDSSMRKFQDHECQYLEKWDLLDL